MFLSVTTALDCEIVIVSGFGIVFLGLAWRFFRSWRDSRTPGRRRHPTQPDPDHTPIGGDRNSQVLLLVGTVWTAYGVVQCLI